MTAVATPVVVEPATTELAEQREVAELEAVVRQPLFAELRDSQREPAGHYDQTMLVAAQSADAGQFRSPLPTHPVMTQPELLLQPTNLERYPSPITFLPTGTIAAPPLAIPHPTTAPLVVEASTRLMPD